MEIPAKRQVFETIISEWYETLLSAKAQPQLTLTANYLVVCDSSYTIQFVSLEQLRTFFAQKNIQMANVLQWTVDQQADCFIVVAVVSFISEDEEVFKGTETLKIRRGEELVVENIAGVLRQQ